MGDSADDYERLDEEAVASIRAGLARALASDAFSAAPQLSAFLSFVVERTLEGRSAELKGYTIAVEALGRPADFDPQADPIVRVEAGRLRRALTQYYAGDGQDDPVRMSMPVGGYVPAFEFVAPGAGAEGQEAEAGEEEAGEGEDVAVLADPAARRWPAAALAGLGCALLALLVWYLEPFGRHPAPPAPGSPPPVRGAATAHAPSSDMIQTVAVAIAAPRVPEDPRIADALRRVSEAFVDVMARFDDIVIVKAPAPGDAAPKDVDYVFEISSVSTGSVLEGFGRLRAAKDGRIVWTTSATRPAGEELQDQDLADIGRRVGTRLAEPFGIIHADFRQNGTSSAMQCIFQALDYRRFLTAEKRNATRECLAKLVERDPEFYPAWAQLAMLGAEEAAAGPEADRRAMLDNALSAALVAMRLAPSGARAQQAMMDVLFLRGTAGDAIKAGREALNRNPYDPDVMADLGSVYVRLNRPAEGLPLLERAVMLSPGRPPSYDFYAYLAAYLTGAKRLSETYASVLAADSTPCSLLGQALQAAANGDSAKRDAALQDLGKRIPRFAADPYLYLTRNGFAAELAQRIVADLGLPVP